jgi:hypothetical protein
MDQIVYVFERRGNYDFFSPEHQKDATYSQQLPLNLKNMEFQLQQNRKMFDVKRK